MGHFPQPLLQKNVDYAVITRMSEPINQELKALPAQTRKKIIFNRAHHKYHHKYFLTLERGRTEHCTVFDSDYLHLAGS